jgi:hypothetical protein
MYKTSRKVESAFSRRARDIINSRRVNRRVNQQRQLSLKQNELDMEQLYLIEDLASNIVENGESQYFVAGKYLEMYFANANLELTEEEIKEIETKIPEGDKKKRFKQYGINPTLRKILYYTLIIAIISALVVPVEGKCRYECQQPRKKREECYRRYGRKSRECHKCCDGVSYPDIIYPR